MKQGLTGEGLGRQLGFWRECLELRAQKEERLESTL